MYLQKAPGSIGQCICLVGVFATWILCTESIVPVGASFIAKFKGEVRATV